MKQRTEIQAVELVRRIRDSQATQLAGKSAAELIEFFNRAADRAKERTAGGAAKARKSPQETT